jgi:hypothetical protein
MGVSNSQPTGRTQMLQFTDQLIICHAAEYIEILDNFGRN